MRRQQLEGTDERAMLGRLLLNLKHVYVEREDYTRALAAVERLLMISPDDLTELRDRGFLQAHLGRAPEAIADLETYLIRTPNAPDTDSVRGRLAWLRKRLGDLMKQLAAEVDEGKLEAAQPAEYYLDYLEAHRADYDL